MTARLAFIGEIENAVVGASAERRGEVLRRVTDLFVSGSEEFTAEDLAMFDGVILRLATAIEQSARALLARRLAPIRNSPPQIIRALAFDDAIDVAGPVLAQSARLDDATLVEIVRTKGQGHMLAISHRGSLSAAVTDVLVELGDRDVMLSTVDNRGASFSDRGFSILVQRSEGDDALAEFVGLRPEIPPHLLAVLIAKASQTVRAKLEAAHPRAKEEVRRAVAEAARHVEARLRPAALDHAAAPAAVERLQRSSRLDERALAEFAKAGAYAETVAALAAMCDLPPHFVEQAMARDRTETLLVLAKAAGLSWSTVREILLLRAEKGVIARDEIVQRLARFERLQYATAQEIVRIYRMRAQAKISPLT